MNAPRLTDTEISQALRAHVPDRAQAGLRERTMEAIRTTTQQRPSPWRLVLGTALGGLRRGEDARPNRWAWVLVAAALLALLAATAIFIGSQRPPLLSTLPEPTTTPTPTASAAVPPSLPAVASTKLTWTKLALGESSPRVAWLGDRFVMVDQDSGAVRTSVDGVSWHAPLPGDPDPGYAELLKGPLATWQNNIVGWWNPEDGQAFAGKPPVTARDILRIVRPPAEPTVTTPWKGRINSIGIGPRGIVAQVHSHLDWDAWVTTKLGPNWVAHYTGVDYKNGVLKIGMDNGPGLKVVWADEGFLPGDYQDMGFGWYSPDGEQWSLMPAEAPSPDGDAVRGFLTGFGEVVGVSDGFIARGVDTGCTSDQGCEGMWYSPDGLTWRNIGNVPAGQPGQVLPWMGGVLVTDGVWRFDFWTSEGPSELPMAAEIREGRQRQETTIGTGPLGMVTLLRDDQEILVTRDGVDWDVQPMPAAMAADQTGRTGPSVIVGERSVLVVLWSGTYEAPIASLWRGTLVP